MLPLIAIIAIRSSGRMINSLWTNLENKHLFCQMHLTDFKDLMLIWKAVIAIQSSERYPSSVVFGRIRKILPFYSLFIVLDSF